MLWTRTLLYAFSSTAFLAVFLLVYGLALAPAQPGARLGVRGLKRLQSLETNNAWAQLEPFVRWLAARVNPLVRGKLRERLDEVITLTGDKYGLSPDDYVALSILSGIAGAVCGGLLSAAFHTPLVWMVLTGVFGAALPHLELTGTAQRRVRRIQNSLPYVIDLISLSLSAGLDFPGALRQVTDKTSDPNDPLTEEINYILHELQLGKTRKQALIEFRTRVPGESVRDFVGAVVQAEERGNPLAEVLRIQAASSRQRRSLRAEEQAAKAGVKIIVPCLFVFAAVVMLIAAPLLLKIGPLLAG